MQIHKNNFSNNNNNEHNKMLFSIQSDEINSVCFECGTNDPDYISINNGVFICKDCVQDHFQFPQEISKIISNDLNKLNNIDLKKLYLGGNKKLIEFINFDFPRLKQYPPNLLYRTRAVDYYRKRLEFYVIGGIRPLKPIFEYAYQLINLPHNNYNNISSYKQELYLSPKVNLINERISSTTKLTPISEGNQNEDENMNSSNSENNNEINNNNKDNKINNDEKLCMNDKPNPLREGEDNFIYSPKKPKFSNSNNNSAFISSNNSYFNKSFENLNIKKNNITEVNFNKNKMPYKKQVIPNFINNLNKNDDLNMNINLDGDKNISDIIILNNNEKSMDNFVDDNTIKAINKYMNNSKESDSFVIKNIKEKDNSLMNDNKNDIIQLVEENNDGKNIFEFNNNIKNNKNDNIKNINNFQIDDNNNINNNKNISNNNIKNNNKEIKPEENNKIKKITKIIKNKNNYQNNINNNLNGKIIDRVIETSEIEIININDYRKNNQNNNINKIEKENKNDKPVNEYKIEEKQSSLIYPKDFDNFSEKSTPSKRKHLKAKISTKKLKDDYDYDNYDNNSEENYKEINQPKSDKLVPYKKNEFFKNEIHDIVPFNEEIYPKKNNFYSDISSSNFLNPLKYLKRSFQRKQEEKFCNDSDENSNSHSQSNNEEDIDDIYNNNSIKLIDKISENDIEEDEKIIKNENKEKNNRKRDSLSKEHDTKESTESQHEDKNINLKEKFKNIKI